MKLFTIIFSVLLLFAVYSSAQVPVNTLIQIVKTEDARRYDETLENLMKSPNPAIRSRAALATGRIGDARAVPALAELLPKTASPEVSAMAAFAIGEIESIKGAEPVLEMLRGNDNHDDLILLGRPMARLVEAAGKIAAANPKDEKAKALGEAILATLRNEYERGAKRDHDVVLLGLTAALRAKALGTDAVVAKFLIDTDARIRADAANTLARIKAKNANATLRKVLVSDTDAVARANAARALGAAEDKDAFSILLTTATEDKDSCVRVSAIRAVGSLKDAKAAGKLLERGEKQLTDYKKSKFAHPIEKNELLEIAAVLGRILPNSNNEKAIAFLKALRQVDKLQSAETEIAFAQVSPAEYIRTQPFKDFGSNWRQTSSLAQGITELSKLKSGQWFDAGKETIDKTAVFGEIELEKPLLDKAFPDVLQAKDAFKTDDSEAYSVEALGHSDVIVRATAAGLLADRPATKENVAALKIAFDRALLIDKHDNDAQLAVMDALFKLDKKESVGTLLVALGAPDYLVRKKAFELLADKDLQKDFPGIPASLEIARSKHKDQVLPYDPASGTKLGQVLNTEADYRRAILRKNGTVKAVLTTEKGIFTIDLMPEDAPLTVDNFIKLARSNYFNGFEVHRVVPNFVMQDGDPRGDGNGGPGWSIRCEINMLPYDRGAVGMALSGKDTGGSQWFVTHSPQPHLDGGYSVFGHVNETDMKVVDTIVRSDKIISVKIVEGSLPQRTLRKKI